MEHLWRIELFGGLRVRHGERLISRFRTQKVGALLAYLAYHPGTSHQRETLTGLLWPDPTPDAARNSLSNALSSLRHQLEPPGVEAGTLLQADRFSVRLNGAVVSTDVAEFEDRLRAADRSVGTYEQSQLLCHALELYSGPLLPGYYEEWVQWEARRLLDKYLQAIRRVIRALAKSGQFSVALDYAHRAVAADPLREESHRDLMRLMLAAGRPTAALQEYREFETRIRDETGYLPSATTRRLAREILQSLSVPSGATVPKANAQSDSQSSLDSSPARTSKTPARDTQFAAAEIYPVGTVTFLLMDTGAFVAPQQPVLEAREQCTVPSNVLLPIIRRYGGCVYKQPGEGLAGVFQSASEALICAVACHRALAVQGKEEPLVRMALHSGDTPPVHQNHQGEILQHTVRILQAANYGQILCSEATGSLLRSACESGFDLQNLGVFRLHNMSVTETLFQVNDAHELPRSFPPPRAAAGYASLLPLPLTRFFGRSGERQRLQELLLLPSTRLVTLSGPGGIGKTRLAIEVARDLVERLAGAVWFVPLADLSEASQIADAILKAQRLARSPRIPAQAQVIAELSRQPCLLVLDNLEHLAEDAAYVVRILLESSETLTCLVTSRRALEIPGEHEFVVAPLPEPISGGTPEQLRFYESVQLFVDRAQSVKPDFQLTHANAGALAQLCSSLEGIPLALELAATRTQVLSLTQMLSQLDRRFDLLVSRRRDTNARHRAMRATIDWSYNLLSEDLQRFFTRLSVFRGGWELAAAEAVCEERMALDYLAQLRESSLVITEEDRDGIRFRMLETLREYGWEKLAAREEDAILRDRHRNYFLALAEQAEPKLVGADQARWFARLEMEHDNLRSVLDWCKARDDGAEAGLQLAGALSRFWRTRGFQSEGRVCLADQLGREGAAVRALARSRALNGAGILACDQGDYANAQAMLEEALDIYRELEDQQGIALSLNYLGNVARLQGNRQPANLLYEESLALSRELSDQHGISVALSNLGNIAKSQGDYESARALYEESLAIRRELRDQQGIVISLTNLGSMAYVQGDYRAAATLFDESLAIAREIGDRGSEALILNNQGLVAKAQGEYEAANALFQQSLGIRTELEDKDGIAASLNDLGMVAYCLGDYVSAKALCEESLAIRRELGDKYGIVESLESFADLAAAEKRPRRAACLWGMADTVRKELGSPMRPSQLARHEEQVSLARSAMGDEVFAAAWGEGSAMTVEQAIEYALADSGNAGTDRLPRL